LPRSRRGDVGNDWREDTVARIGCPTHTARMDSAFERVKNGPLRLLAHETNTPIETISALYEEEVARLASTARVRRFIPVIAARRVRRRLLHL
jgi:Protein of unknown function (DUF3562)